MSSDDGNGGPGRREVAYRLFAAEFDDADYSYSESDEERAPNYVITPTGLRANRLFAAGVLTEVEHVNDDVLRGRVVDPTGAFVTYAGQYQPDEMAFLERTDPPAFVALTGKARTFEPEDSDRVFTSVRPESINVVDADTRDRWTVSAAEATLERVAVFADALELDVRGDDLRESLLASGVSESLAAGIPLAIDHYGTTPAYLDAVRRLALDALGLVAGERDEVRPLEAAPDEEGPDEVGPIPDVGAPTVEAAAGAGGAGAAAASATTESEETTAETAETETTETAEPAESVETPATSAEATETTESAETTESTETTESVGSAETTEATESTESAETTEPTEASTTPDAPAETTAESTAATATDVGSDVDATGDFDDSATDTAGGSEDADSGGLGDFEDDSSGLGDFEDTGSATDDDSDGLGDFEDSDAESADADESVDEAGMYELDDEERREIEEEYGTEFSSGAEVGEPGEAGIDVPDADDLQESAEGGPEETTAPTAEPESADTADVADVGDTADVTDTAESDVAAADDAAEPEAESDDEAAASTAEADDEAPDDAPADVDVESVAIESMKELDDGDGAEREQVVAAVVDEYGVDPGEVEDAIQSALMSGRCYEPTEDRLKAI